MGKASSSKKVARAARAGGSPNARKRNWAFPAALLAIAVLGLAIIVLARKTDQTASADAPAVGDHWHNAYGVYVCDKFLDPIPTPAEDKLGIHTHGDGVIHIHPFQGGSAGKNATMQVFADTVGMKFGPDSFTMPDGTKYANGFDCNGKPATVAVYKWVDALDGTPTPTVYTSDFGSIRFTEEWSAFTFAVVPEGTTVPEPDLQRLKDIRNGAPEEPATTAPGAAAASSTTAPGASSTTASTAKP